MAMLGIFAGLGLVFWLFYILVFVAAILATVQAYQAKRSGWWIYLICIFIGPLNLIAAVAWFAYFKTNPTKLGNLTI